jgi:hypothetical protein
MEVKISVGRNTLVKKGTIRVQIENDDLNPSVMDVKDAENALEVNNVIYSQRTMSKKPTSGSKGIKLQKSSSKTVLPSNKFTTSEITKLLLQMGMVY